MSTPILNSCSEDDATSQARSNEVSNHDHGSHHESTEIISTSRAKEAVNPIQTLSDIQRQVKPCPWHD
jgi:hypothetical protein